MVYSFSSSGFSPTRWRDIRVGDIVKVQQDEPISADLLILKTTDEKGACYVETKNLDGETNLKQKHAEKKL